MKKGRRPRRRPRLKLSDRAGPDQCPVPGENALFPAQIAGFLAVSRPVPVYPVFLNYVVPVQTGSLSDDYNLVVLYRQHGKEFLICSLGSSTTSSRYDDVSVILKTIDESNYLSGSGTTGS